MNPFYVLNFNSNDGSISTDAPVHGYRSNTDIR